MRNSSATRVSIVDATCSALASVGVEGLTVGAVARAAGVSTALVHYHFATKKQLLAAGAERLAARRTAGRSAALARGAGLPALDALWAALVEGAAAGAERAWHDLLLMARRDAGVLSAMRAERAAGERAMRAALPRLLAELGAAPLAAVDDLARTVVTFLDGVALALAGGEPAEEIRPAFDAFWLALIAAGQPRARR